MTKTDGSIALVCLVYIAVWITTMAAWIYHVAQTVIYAQDVVNIGYFMWLILGCVFPPFGVANGIIMYLT